MDTRTNTLAQLPQLTSPTEEEPLPILEVEDTEQPTIIGEVPDFSLPTLPKDIFTRLTKPGPFLPVRVEQNQARALRAEFIDVFALSVREVKPVDFIKFHQQIPPEAMFTKKVHQ
ncbi:hypothetical protein BDR07DRAFT_1488702 [Suillus spraguei]|nr:hypothetical protein BDR07DRAFT_1488702 [Suillus spraguei]